MVEIGDTVFESLQIGEARTTKPYKGKVIYIHPKKRFFRAEFKMDCGVIREAFIISPKKDKRRMNERVH